MAKSKKILKSVIIGVVVLILIAALVIYLAGNFILKTGIENVASSTLQTEVTLDKASLSIFAGEVELDGLVVKNLPEYDRENFLVLNSGHISTRTLSLLTDTVQVNEIRLSGLDLVVEQRGLSTNLQQILNNLPEKEEPDPDAKKLHINKLRVENINVTIITDISGAVTISLPVIEMENMGTDDNLSVAILIQRLLVAISKGIAEQAGGILPDELLEPLQDTLDGVFDIGDGVFKGIEGIFRR